MEIPNRISSQTHDGFSAFNDFLDVLVKDSNSIQMNLKHQVPTRIKKNN